MKKKDTTPASLPDSSLPITVDGLLKDLRGMINQAQEFVASTVNTKITMLYWQIGKRVHKEILK